MAEAQLRTSKFGERYLTDPSRVFEHNAWDNVAWDAELQTRVEQLVTANSDRKLPDDDKARLLSDASQHWESFYKQHQSKFFKDRHWLFTEFPELLGRRDSCTVVLEVGCGAGNTVFPILQTTRHEVFIHCCDFSSAAIELMKKHPLYNSDRCSAFVHDITSEDRIPLPPSSVDYITVLFVLSALDQSKVPVVLRKLSTLLRRGGKLLFRDYGRLDMAQVRFKPGQCLADNFYVRGDKTLVYFFTEDEIATKLEEAGLVKELLHTDRRLQVNRGKQLKMYRVWIQAKYTHPTHKRLTEDK